MDVVFYYNRHDYCESDSPTPEFERIDCRSFSIVSNRYVMVWHADANAPAFLREAKGVRHNIHSSGDEHIPVH